MKIGKKCPFDLKNKRIGFSFNSNKTNDGYELSVKINDNYNVRFFSFKHMLENIDYQDLKFGAYFEDNSQRLTIYLLTLDYYITRFKNKFIFKYFD